MKHQQLKCIYTHGKSPTTSLYHRAAFYLLDLCGSQGPIDSAVKLFRGMENDTGYVKVQAQPHGVARHQHVEAGALVCM